MENFFRKINNVLYVISDETWRHKYVRYLIKHRICPRIWQCHFRYTALEETPWNYSSALTNLTDTRMPLWNTRNQCAASSCYLSESVSSLVVVLELKRNFSRKCHSIYWNVGAAFFGLLIQSFFPEKSRNITHYTELVI